MSLKMKKLSSLFLIITFFSCENNKKLTKNVNAQPPNIIIIYTDDQGYGDLSSYGSMSINTPNIDALAKNGAKLTSFLNASSTCSPSRAALLTGSYPIRTGVTKVLWPRSGGMWGGGNSKTLKGLNPNEITSMLVKCT